ncbi:MAG: glycosyltransferase family 9 protein [Planctomycetota bacterium]|jgi:ADP-heptose:LPS heptosyltransferase
MKRKKEKILVVRLSSGGDVLQALPALAILRRRSPGAHIAFLVEDRFARFVEGRVEIDEILVWPRSRWSPMWKSLRAPLALLECIVFWAALAKSGFRTVLDFQGNLKSGLHTAFTRAPLRIGFSRGSSKEGNRLFTNRKVAPFDEKGSRVEKYVDLLGGMGIEGERASPVPPPRGSAEAFSSIAESLDLKRGRFRIIHPGTSAFGSFKRWPLERWRQLAERLCRSCPLLISWGPGEEETARSFGGIVGVRVPPGPLLVAELAGALVEALSFTGTDSAPLHLAHALGTPSVALFGPTDPTLYGPWMSGRALSAGVDCSPCSGRRCARIRCMDAIEVDDVERAIEDLESEKG